MRGSGISVDLRSLGVFRIGVALVLLFDLCDRSRSLFALHGENGVLPSAALREGEWTFHALSPDPAWLVGLFLLHAVVAVLLLVGWRTRPITVLCWLLTLSLQNRNQYILYGGDQVLMHCLLWGCFLPWGRRFSLDARRLKPVGDSYRSWAATILMGQLAAIYLVTAILKNGPQWLSEGTGVYHAVTALQYEQPIGQLLRGLLIKWPLLDHLLTFATVGWEYLVGILLFTPFRDLAALSIILFHFGIFSTLMVGFFPEISATLALAAFTTACWDRLLPGTASAATERLEEVRWHRLLLVPLVFISLAHVAHVVSPWTAPTTVIRTVRALRLGQGWNMFAPASPVEHGWYSARGITPEGKSYELLIEGREEWTADRPAHVPSSIGGMRWNMLCFVFFPHKGERNKLGPLMVYHLQHRWERAHPGQVLAQIELIYHQAEVVPYQDFPFEENVVWRERLYR